jgi:hypothetical protein
MAQMAMVGNRFTRVIFKGACIEKTEQGGFYKSNFCNKQMQNLQRDSFKR